MAGGGRRTKVPMDSKSVSVDTIHTKNAVLIKQVNKAK